MLDKLPGPIPGAAIVPLAVTNLNLGFEMPTGFRQTLFGVDLEIRSGEIVALVGESGSGKTICALSVMGLLPGNARIMTGQVRFMSRTLIDGPKNDFKGIRGARMGMVFQEPMSSLNPVLKVGEQVGESLVRHQGMSWRDAHREAVRMLDRVGIADAGRRAEQYVHQLSGGMRQRVMIASAMICKPQLLIADEPTTALDVTVQAQILDLIRGLRDETGMSVLFITHDLGVVADVADRAYLMYAGRVVEEGSTRAVLRAPLMPYTRGLLASLPDPAIRRNRLNTLPGTVPDLGNLPSGCSFSTRCKHVESACKQALPPLERVAGQRQVRCLKWRTLADEVSDDVSTSNPAMPGAEGVEQAPGGDDRVLVSVRGLTKQFPVDSSIFRRGTRLVRAVDGVDFTVHRGEVLALVGESGSGKTTIGRCMLRLTEPTSGSVIFDGTDVSTASSRRMTLLRRRMQIVFQDPFSSLNPKRTIGAALAEPIRVHGLVKGGAVRDRVVELLRMVGLSPEHMGRYPGNFSGGQRQRIAIARALAVNPELLVADEAVSALDVSIRAQISNLLQDLRERLSLTLLFIAHDLSLVRQISDRVVILYLGRVMEAGPVGEVFNEPRHPYTRVLLSAIPVPDPDVRRERIILKGDMPSPLAPPTGCVFRTRCPKATPDCASTIPPAVSVGDDHVAACLYAR